jgi:hypothetical protein
VLASRHRSAQAHWLRRLRPHRVQALLHRRALARSPRRPRRLPVQVIGFSRYRRARGAAAAIVGAGVSSSTGTGSLAGSAEVAGAGTAAAANSGALVAQAATVAGLAFRVRSVAVRCKPARRPCRRA